ncbi:MAG: hypothetical protein IID18_07445 [Nitrospinae bacterium]|nr:hypothetical protein [Nitrospinota bacterium]
MRVLARFLLYPLSEAIENQNKGKSKCRADRNTGIQVAVNDSESANEGIRLVPARGRALGLELENTPDRDPEVELATGLTNQGFELENFAEESNGQSTSSATDRARAQRLDLTE